MLASDSCMKTSDERGGPITVAALRENGKR
jgi:hypothetical protein